MSSELISTVIPEAITNPQAFEQGYIYGEQAATNDLAAQRVTTDEALGALVSRLGLHQGLMPTDWYAGLLAGYRVRRAL